MRAGRVNNAHCKRTHSVARCLSRTRVDASVVWSLLINSSNGSCTTRRSFPIFASMFPLCSPPPSSTSVYRGAVLMVKKKKKKGSKRCRLLCISFRWREREREGGGDIIVSRQTEIPRLSRLVYYGRKSLRLSVRRTVPSIISARKRALIIARYQICIRL